MKIRTMATATTTILGTALLGYGQGPNQKPGNTGSVGGTGAGVIEQGVGNPDGTPGEAALEEEDVRVMRDMDWTGAEELEVDLDQVPEATRTVITNAASGADLDDNVVRLTRDGRVVYRATATRDGQEDTLIYAREDGTLVRTERRVDWAQAPANVRASIAEEWGENITPADFRLVTAGEENYYVARSGAEADAETIRIDGEGNILDEPETPQARDRSGDNLRGAAEGRVDE